MSASTFPGVENARTILFVYGTLKRDRRNHQLIADQQYLGEAATEPRYRLIDLGPYPGLIPDEENGLAVRGELWAVTWCCLVELDDFEGGDYARGPVTVDGCGKSVQAYFWAKLVPDGVRIGAEWPFS
jgi:gamma-glutamylaminecyclotransferase